MVRHTAAPWGVTCRGEAASVHSDVKQQLGTASFFLRFRYAFWSSSTMLTSANTQAGPVESRSQRDAGCAGALLVTLTSLHVQGRDHAWTTMRGLCSRSSLCSSLAQRPNRGWGPSRSDTQGTRLALAGCVTPHSPARVGRFSSMFPDKHIFPILRAIGRAHAREELARAHFRAAALPCRQRVSELAVAHALVAEPSRLPCALPESEGQEHELQRCVLGDALEDTFSCDGILLSIRGILFTQLTSPTFVDRSLYEGLPSLVSGTFWNSPHRIAHDMARVKTTDGDIRIYQWCVVEFRSVGSTGCAQSSS